MTIQEQLEELKNSENWGTYYINEFYFTINTRKKKSDYHFDKGELPEKTQRQLQYENFPALIHEYTHYLHELSTVVGSICSHLDILQKTIFSRNFDTDLESSVNQGIYKQDEINYVISLHNTLSTIFGSSALSFINKKLINISSIKSIKKTLKLPSGFNLIDFEIDIPIVNYKLSFNSKVEEKDFPLGKFIIYEGIAYELDREVEKNIHSLTEINDVSRNTEYTVLRDVAKSIFPEIKKQIYLSVASLSLQYIDCGNSFVRMIYGIKENCSKGITQDETLKEYKKTVSDLMKQKRIHFKESQEEYKEVFYKRRGLYKAYSYICDKMILLYDKRIENPTFEIDAILKGQYVKLVESSEICDYMYLFNDKTDFMRDFLGTTLTDKETSHALKVLACYNNYYKSHRLSSTITVEKKQVKCPYYHCCDLPIRISQPEICWTKPWRSFEISAKNGDGQYCWYGQGVLEFKGHNEI